MLGIEEVLVVDLHASHKLLLFLCMSDSCTLVGLIYTAITLMDSFTQFLQSLMAAVHVAMKRL